MDSRPCAECGQPAQFICSACKLINYCCKEHQKVQWPQHKAFCKPAFELYVDEEMGRSLRAARNIRAGELILQEPPIATGPKSLSTPVCLGCHTSLEGKTEHECDGCGFPLCSPQCQISDLHFDECQLMMRVNYRLQRKENDSDRSRQAWYCSILPLRVMILKQKHPEKYKKIMELQSHLPERINTPLYSVYKQNIAGFLNQRLCLIEFDEETILGIVAILETNAFEIRTKNKENYRGIYGLASMIAHDCTPNTKHTFHGKERSMAVWATTDIKKGAPIFATYTQTLWPTLTRQEHLLQAKCFNCKCKRCMDSTELGTYIGAIRCTKCATQDNYRDGPKIVSTDPLDSQAPWKCYSCGHQISAKLMKQGMENLKKEITRLDKTSPKVLEDFIEKYEGVLHPFNTFVIQVKHALVQLYGNKPGILYSELPESALERKIDYCQELLEVLEMLEPGQSRIRGQLLHELQATMAMNAKMQFQNDKITKDAAQQTLVECLELLKEVVEIFRNEPDVDEVRERLEALSKELGD